MHLPINVTSTGYGATAKYCQLVGDVSEPTSKRFDAVLNPGVLLGDRQEAAHTIL